MKIRGLLLKGYIDVDELLANGYEEKEIMALLGQRLINMALLDLFSKKIEFTDESDRHRILKYGYDIVMFHELNQAHLFWHSFQYSKKMECSFGKYVRVFMDYIDCDFKKLCKYTKIKSKDMKRYIKKVGGDVFGVLVNEADCLWQDTRMLEVFSKKHELPAAALFETVDFSEGCPRLSESLQKEATKRHQAYMMIPKKNYLVRLGVKREDVLGTSFEYLYDKEFEYSDYHEGDDLYWSWEG